VRDPEYADGLGNPFNNITARTARLLSASDRHERYTRFAIRAYRSLKQAGTTLDFEEEARVLADRLLRLRLGAAAKLQGFNPLHTLVRVVSKALGATATYGAAPNLLADLTPDRRALAEFDLFTISRNGRTVLLCVLYVDDYGGLDKAKEWAARGRSFLYRLRESEVVRSQVQALVFVADGPWKEESVRRLRLGGWLVCRPSELAAVLATAIGAGR
jgi:hypothetical protein